MIVRKFSAVSHLLQLNAAQALAKVGIHPSPDTLAAYCKHCFSRADQTFLTLQDQDPLGVIELHSLNWDSNIYDLPIGVFGTLSLAPNLVPEERFRWTTELVRGAVIYAFAHQMDMLVCRVQLADLFWIQALEQARFQMMDVQCPMALKNLAPKHIDAIVSSTRVTIRDASPDDVPAIVSFGKSGFGRSHLYADPRLPKGRSDELHEAWLRNDCSGRAAFVLVATVNDRVCGFIAGLWDDIQERILGVGHGHIDLIAVTEDMRGRGIGSHLTAAALHRFLDRGANLVTVSTQATNLGAIRLYQRCGFELSGFEVTLHAWRQAAGDQT